MKQPESIGNVLDVLIISGNEAKDCVPQLVIELPHGATETRHYQNHRKCLQGNLPKDIEHFFYVNTDIGSPEVGFSLANTIVKAKPTTRVLVLRSLIPRTFIDCNRILSADAEMYKSGGVTPGVPPYIENNQDIKYLFGLHQKYQAAVKCGIDWVCRSGGRALYLHTYAPRSVGIQKVDADIVSQLHWAYHPKQLQRWSIRPQVDFITNTPDAVTLCDERWLGTVKKHLLKSGLHLGTGSSYPLHPVTTAYHHSSRHPNQTLCMEIRRDLLVKAFTPFAQMQADPNKVAVFGEALSKALVELY